MEATSTKVVGKVIQVAGPAVDIQFAEGQIPVINTAVRITSEGFDETMLVRNTLHRDRRQLQTRHPAFGSTFQSRNVFRR